MSDEPPLDQPNLWPRWRGHIHFLSQEDEERFDRQRKMYEFPRGCIVFGSTPQNPSWDELFKQRFNPSPDDIRTAIIGNMP